MKKKIILLLCLILTIILILISWTNWTIKKERKELFQNGTYHFANYHVVENQKKINQKLEKILEKKEYTLKNAYVLQNPYEISPLSAIIIFHTEEDTEIKVYINEEFVTTTEKTTNHSIPIYGLLEDAENKIKIVSNQEEQEYIIKTEKSNLKPLEILKNNISSSKELYFMTASYESGISAYDLKGNLRFYLTEMYRMDVEWLENGHFLIGVPEGQYAENFYAFVEIDYLGKIYNYYTLEHGFSFETQILKNGNYLISGGENPVYINKQVITEINPTNGQTEKMINIYDVFKSIDTDFDEKYLGQAAIRNGFYLKEDTNQLIVSFRGMNAIISINYQDATLNWIFTNPENELFKRDVWKSYLVKSTDNFYPWGQHAPIITKEGHIAFFNNGYDRYHGFEVGGNDLISTYKENYSRAEIYEIKNNTSKRIWVFDANKQLFSHQYGSFIITEENTKLINFGWTLNEEFKKKKDAKLSTSEQNIENTHAHIFELDENNNIILEAKCEEGKYRVMKHTLYHEITENIPLSYFHEYNSIKKEEVQKVQISNQTLNQALLWNYDLTITKNFLKTSYNITEDDELDLYFINEKGNAYIMNYKKKKDKILNRIFHLSLKEDDYLVYMKLNGTLWKTNQILTF